MLETEIHEEIARIRTPACTNHSLFEKARAIRSLLEEGSDYLSIADLTNFNVRYLETLDRLNDATSLSIILVWQGYTSVQLLSFLLSMFSPRKSEKLLLQCLHLAEEQCCTCNLDYLKSLVHQFHTDKKRITASQREILLAYLSKQDDKSFYQYLAKIFSYTNANLLPQAIGSQA